MTENILVFPGGMPDGLAYRERAKAQGLTVIGASSLEADPAAGAYDAWARLPYIADPGFDAALADVVARHAITAVHTPHFVVWKHLSERLGAIAPGARLTRGQTLADHEQAYRALRARSAAAAPPAVRPGVSVREPLTAMERAGLVRLADTIPGMCGEDKMGAIIEIARHAPAGDIVEIGSWWGRSAALLVWLARRYDIGKVLCVDPWLSEALAQGEATVDAASAVLDTEEALRIFEVNLAPLAGGALNYIRARSHDAAPLYRPGLVARTEAFGETAYAGRIAILHIDGNHAEEEARRDTELWTPHVAPGGWIIFDDYEWAFGDGPKVVADAFVAAQGENIVNCFQLGVSLFVQLRGKAHA